MVKNLKRVVQGISMKRAVLLEPKRIFIEDVDIPKIGDYEVLVRNRVSLTCGTDVKNYHRGYPLLKPPHPFGHEFAGEVIEVGKKVLKFNVGDRVVAHNSAPCNSCYYCKNGQHSLCDSLEFNRGAYAEYVKVPQRIVEQNMFALPDSMSYKTAALMEPFSCAVYGIEEVPIKQGDVVVVIGAGPIGLMFIKLAYLKGAKVIACDLSEYRLQVAKKLGASTTILSGDNLKEDVLNETENLRGADIVVEATGIIEVWNQSIDLVRKGGTVLLFGGTKKGTELIIDANRIHYNQISVKGVFHTTPICVERAFRLLEMGVIDENDFVQNEYSINDVEAALLEHSEQKVIKNCIIYE